MRAWYVVTVLPHAIIGNEQKIETKQVFAKPINQIHKSDKKLPQTCPIIFSMNKPSIAAILVPQGAEYQAVCRGLSRLPVAIPTVLPIPVGSKPLIKYLEKLQQTGHFFDPNSNVLLMGLCGGLTPAYGVGDVVIYQNCLEIDAEAEKYTQQLECDRALTTQLYHHLNQKPALVKSLTSPTVIHSAAQKRQLGQVYTADVVDMEGFAALDFLSKFEISVAMVRVISDDCHADLPNLTSAISPDGGLQPIPLAINMIKEPLPAFRLIRGSLTGLRVLQNVTTELLVNG
jgi:Phosphorylase superfamily